jgi:cell division topological specificity factor
MMRDLLLRLIQSTRGAGSGADAKQRLKFVLLHDQVDLTPVQMEKMKDEIMEVIARYVDVDAEAVEFRLDKEEGHVALVSNIPVRRVTARAAG